MGQQINFVGTYTKTTPTGFKQNVKRKQAASSSVTCLLNGALS